jgi:excisionase family DNA binding protein
MLHGETTKRSNLDPGVLSATPCACSVARLRGEPELWVILDGSDVRKPHARAMEGLQRAKRLAGRGAVPGYRTLKAIDFGHLPRRYSRHVCLCPLPVTATALMVEQLSGGAAILSAREAARPAGIFQHSITRWCALDSLPATKQDDCWRIAPDDLMATLKARYAGDVVPRWRFDPVRAGRRLRQLREPARLSQLEIGRACDLSHEVVSKRELGQKRPIGETVRRLATVLDVTPEAFVDDSPLGLSLLSTREAAAILDVPFQRVCKWVQTGILPGYKVRVHWRIPTVAVADLTRSGRLRRASHRLAPRCRG